MRKLIVGVLALCVIGMSAHAALEAGTMAPEFSARASLAGTEFDFSLAQALEQGPVVVYFYPSAYTSGCNIQARQFAVHMEDFEAAGATVIGVSLDSIERLNAFSADPEYCAGKLAVASDSEGEIARSYALAVRETAPGKLDTRGEEITHARAERVTYVVASDGRIAATIGGISPMENVQQSLEAVRRLAASY